MLNSSILLTNLPSLSISNKIDAIAVIKEQKAKKVLEEAKAQEAEQQQQQGEQDKVCKDDLTKTSPANSSSSPADTSSKGSQQQQQAPLSTGAGKRKQGTRPVSTTAIPGTPWCIVWTDQNKVFYFNPSTKTSVWDRPPELRNRDDVDKLVSNPPPILTQKTTTTSTSTTTINNNGSRSGIIKNDEDDNSRHSSTSESRSEKKIKLDTNNDISNGSASLSHKVSSPNLNNDNNNSNGATNSNGEIVVSVTSKNSPAQATTVVKKEVTSDIEREAAKKRETIPLAERIETFRQMLDEREVNPLSTFQKELRKIVFDARYLLLTSNERREVFEKYCLEKTEEEREKRRKRIKKATDEFKLLLQEANLTSRSVYDDFHDQYSQDPRYKALERTKDREILFDDHLALLRRREREERSQSGNVGGSSTSAKHHRSSSSSSRHHSGHHHHSHHHEHHRDHSRDDRRGISRDTSRSPAPHVAAIPSTSNKYSSSASNAQPSAKSIAIDNFKQLLRETKLIDKDTRKKIEESEHQHLIDIVCALQTDLRYKAMESMSEERRRILLNYIEELARSSAPASTTTLS